MINTKNPRWGFLSMIGMTSLVIVSAVSPALAATHKRAHHAKSYTTDKRAHRAKSYDAYASVASPRLPTSPGSDGGEYNDPWSPYR
jgi:hypothetical protein